jgi:hypothetical protein
MSRARYPLPTDLVALVSFDGRVYPNEAKPFDRLGLDERARPLEEALEQWFFFASGKQTYVNVKGATIRGMINARPRGKRSAWEVEALIDADDDKAVVSSLFSRMLAGIGRVGAQRVFVRLDAGSAIVRAARDAGFFPYQAQTLYRLTGKVRGGARDVGLRAKSRQDMHGIFQLYMHAVPANVRAIEGATFKEWQAALEPWVDDMLNEAEERGARERGAPLRPLHEPQLAWMTSSEQPPRSYQVGRGCRLYPNRMLDWQRRSSAGGSSPTAATS